MAENPWDEPSSIAWANHVLETMVPALADSVVSVSIVPDAGLDELGIGDVKYWVELGASICMGKPITLVVLGDRDVPPRLAAIADEIVRLPEGVSLASSEELADRIVAFADGAAE